ncbi:PAS domain-containing protein [Geomonas sp. RF6]|uniref:ATP-binding protein n=1 Tax=Geomonas sp. RF6 TaxID=2897342 RepID=UPI001E285B23|nr:ATP-binding protein [Geomonas sp. RF6]UFS69016.1 PAS domain-containing protein [Geomonas sp. RF6]
MTASDSTDESRRAFDLLSSLNEILIFAAKANDVGDVMTCVVTASAQALGSDSAALFRREGEQWVVSRGYHLPQAHETATFSDEELPHAALAVMARKAVLIEDACTDMRANNALMQEYGIRSLMAVPVLHEDGIVAALSYHFHTAPRTFSQLEKDYALKVSDALATAQHNAAAQRDLCALREKLTEAKHLGEAINRIDRMIYSNLDTDEIFRKVIAAANDALGAESAILFLKEGEDWHVRYVHKLSQTLVGRVFRSDEVRKTEMSAQAGEIVTICHTRHGSSSQPQLMAMLDIRSLLEFPLIVKGEVIGSLSFHYHSRLVEFTELQKDFAAKLHGSVSFALQTARLFKALMESDSCLRMAEKIGKWGYFHYDRVRSKLTWSEGMFQIFRRDPALGTPSLEEFLETHFQKEEIEGVRKDVLGDRSRHFEAKVKTGDTFAEVQVLIDSLPCESCETAARLGTVQDITDRRQAESFKQGILDSLPAHIAVIDKDATILDINRPWLRFAEANGATGRAGIGVGVNYLSVCRKAADEADPLAREALEGIESVLSGDRDHFELEYPCDSPDEKRWYLMHVLRPTNHFGGAVIAHLDITERKLAEEARHQSEQRLASFMEHLPAAAWMKDPGGHYLYVNPEVERTISVPMATLQGKTDEEIFGQDMARLFGEKEKRVLAEGGIRTIETLPLHDGRDHHFLVSRFGVPGSDGPPVQLCGVAIDITDRIAAQEEVERLNSALEARAADLEEVNAQLEAFNYSVSHDLRQPLNVICGYSQGIPMECGNEMSESCSEYVKQIYRAALRMNDLIDAMLRFSRLTKSELRRETVDLSGHAKAVLTRLRLEAPERRVEVKVQEGVVATCDEGLVTVVLENLLGNAWKYSGERESTIIEFGRKIVAGEDTFFVSDNGIGFDMAHVEKLFQPFQRLPGADAFRGHGIGLATVERIVKKHGGRVWAESHPGRGATFYFTLPE